MRTAAEVYAERQRLEDVLQRLDDYYARVDGRLVELDQELVEIEMRQYRSIPDSIDILESMLRDDFRDLYGGIFDPDPGARSSSKSKKEPKLKKQPKQESASKRRKIKI